MNNQKETNNPSQPEINFKEVVQLEEELDTFRQLLNEQISFNLKDLYIIVAGTSSSINYMHIVSFVKDLIPKKQKGTKLNSIIQSFIRFYNGNHSLNMSFSEFSSVFLNRQNRLLMKMTLERDSIGTLPNFILNFSKKILSKEIQLHSLLLQFRKSWSKDFQVLLSSVSTIDQYIDQTKLISYLCSIFEKPLQTIKIQFQIFMRYVNPFMRQNIEKEILQTLFVNSNAQTVTQFLRDKARRQNNNKIMGKSSSLDKIKKFTDPFVRPEFHDCLARPKITDIFSYREVKSIEKHLDRLNQTNSIDKQAINEKLKKFETIIQKNCQSVLQAIKDILWLEKQIQYARVDLSLCPDFYPVLFFESFHRDKQNRLIPSVMQIFFKQFGIKIPLNQIYLLFKRYAWHLQGKMDFNSFCSIFDVCQAAYSRIQKNRQVKCLGDVDVQTKKNFLILLATIIKNEKKIDSIKTKLQKFKDMNLRDVFACFDADQDGYLSITDFRVIWKKYFNIEISKEMIHLLWFRMGHQNQNQIIKYEEFIKEMLPKGNSDLFIQKKLKKVKSQNILKSKNKEITKKIR